MAPCHQGGYANPFPPKPSQGRIPLRRSRFGPAIQTQARVSSVSRYAQVEASELPGDKDR